MSNDILRPETVAALTGPSSLSAKEIEGMVFADCLAAETARVGRPLTEAELATLDRGVCVWVAGQLRLTALSL